MIKAIVFDMDGVIVDSEPMHAAANVIALEQYGLSMPAEYYLGFAGTTKYRMMEILIERHNINATAGELCRAADQQNDIIYEKDGFTEVSGVSEMVKRLHASGLKLAVASSSPYRDINNVLDYFHIKDYFQVILSGQDETFQPKPAPDIYINAVRKLGVEPFEAVAIEDTDTGLKSAYDAGLVCYGYRNIHSGNQTLSLARKIITDYNSIDNDYFQWEEAVNE